MISFSTLNEFTGGEGPVIGEKVQFNVTFTMSDNRGGQFQ
jgi:hypothetical protein